MAVTVSSALKRIKTTITDDVKRCDTAAAAALKTITALLLLCWLMIRNKGNVVNNSKCNGSREEQDEEEEEEEGGVEGVKLDERISTLADKKRTTKRAAQRRAPLFSFCVRVRVSRLKNADAAARRCSTATPRSWPSCAQLPTAQGYIRRRRRRRSKSPPPPIPSLSSFFFFSLSVCLVYRRLMMPGWTSSHDLTHVGDSARCVHSGIIIISLPASLPPSWCISDASYWSGHIALNGGREARLRLTFWLPFRNDGTTRKTIQVYFFLSFNDDDEQ